MPQDTLYTRFCNVPASGCDICPNVGWFRDFTDPQSLLEPTFKGAAIKPQGNVNYSMLDVPEIDDAMTKAATIPAGAERNEAWAEINRMVVGQAPGDPVLLGRLVPAGLQGRPGRDERLHDDLGLRVLVASSSDRRSSGPAACVRRGRAAGRRRLRAARRQ